MNTLLIILYLQCCSAMPFYAGVVPKNSKAPFASSPHEVFSWNEEGCHSLQFYGPSRTGCAGTSNEYAGNPLKMKSNKLKNAIKIIQKLQNISYLNYLMRLKRIPC